MILRGLADLPAPGRDAAPRLQLGPHRRQLRLRVLSPGPTATVATSRAPAIIRHIWCTMAAPRNPLYARTTVLRMYWDGAATPCVEAPIGDFFGIGHGIVKNFWSLPLSDEPAGRPRASTAGSPCPSPAAPASR